MIRQSTNALTCLAAAGALLLAGCSSSSTQPAPSVSAAGSDPASSDATAPAVTAESSPEQPPEYRSSDGRLDVTLTAAVSEVPYADTTRWALTYNGSTTSPTLRVRPGDVLTVRLVNDLPEPTNLHTHGLHVSPDGDSDNVFVTVNPGQERTYRYEIPADHPSGTFWYHPHRHGLTAKQVAAGLAGAIIVEDEIDATLDAVSDDHVLVVSDPPLVNEDPWPDAGHDDSGMGGMMGGSGVSMMESMMGRNGQRLLTNGQDGVTISPEPGRLQRLRLVNATASSRVRFAASSGEMTRVASEGGRLTTPESMPIITLAPGERTEVLLEPGTEDSFVIGQRLSNDGGDAALTQPELVATIKAAPDAATPTMPSSVAPPTRDLFATDVTVDRVREISLDGHMNPTINGEYFDPDVINMTAKLGTVEEWVITNNTPMVHPIHLHAWPFQVDGEAGWQDVVTVQPGEQQTIRVSYEDFGGTTVLHCHILDHEDGGMMLVIRVEE